MSINAHQEFIEDDEQEVPYHPIGRLSQVVPQNKRKNQQRALKRRVFEKRVTKGMMKKVLTLYNFETGLDSLIPEVLSSLEQLFRLQDIHWPTEFERFHLIIEKIHLALRSLLRQYGYYDFQSYAVDHIHRKARLQIMPCPGQAPPELPPWLRIPYLVLVKGVRCGIIFEGPMNSCIQRGDPLYQELNETPVGTLGTVMISNRTYVALTAGHILADGDRTMVLRRNIDESVVDLKIAKYSMRYSGRPLGRLNERIGFQDDCAFLTINQQDLTKFEHYIPCVDPHFYTPQTVGETDAGDPISQSRRFHIEKQVGTEGLVVYKQGSSTDLTMGLLVKIEDVPPKGWYVVDDDSDKDEESKYMVFERDSDDNDVGDEQEDKDSNEWLGIVRWYDDFPFTGPGDSGSLVFAKEGNVTVPLGIHVGCPASVPNHSVFISIETFCFEAEKEGWELRFTER